MKSGVYGIKGAIHFRKIIYPPIGLLKINCNIKPSGDDTNVSSALKNKRNIICKYLRGYMNKITILENKTLKLQNVLSVQVDLESESDELFDIEINKLNTYIQTHGAKQTGPLIQATSFEIKDDGAVDIKMQFMLQTDNFIHNVEPPYKMDSILRVKNCLYARYIGPEDKLKFAYDKLGVYAFENDIELDGCNYTIYVDRNEEDEIMVADVFMPVKE